MGKVCLIILFNHRYDANIDRLERIYKNRFSHIRYIVPFYDGPREDVIPVYECSFRFSGYVTQAYEKFAGDFDHYFFVADDIALHPDINEDNYEEWFGVDDKTCYIPIMEPVGRLGDWPYRGRFMDPEWALCRYSGTLWKDEIMSADEAFAIAEKKGFTKKDFQYTSKSIWRAIRGKYWKRHPRLFIMFWKPILLGPQTLPYPLWGKYSDIFIIPQKYMKDMSRMFGIFAGMNLFVEIAIPTAIELLSEQVSTGENRTEKPSLLWTVEERQSVIDKHNGIYSDLMENWDSKDLFIHPVKLSQWK